MLIFSLIIISIICFCFAIQSFSQNSNFSEYKKEQEILTENVITTLNIDKKSFSQNIKYFNDKKCPYCKEIIENKKSTSFLCSKCKKKIYRKKHFLNEKTLYLTEQESFLFTEEKEKYSKYRKFCSLCRKLNQTGIIHVNEKDIQGTIAKLHFGEKSFYNKKTFFDLRICRYYEGMVQEIYGTVEQATNAYMSVLYLDLFGNYDTLEYQWSDGNIFPHAYEAAFQEDLPLEKFEEIFLFNANSLVENLQFTPPITPQEAWQEILKYREENNKK